MGGPSEQRERDCWDVIIGQIWPCPNLIKPDPKFPKLYCVRAFRNFDQKEQDILYSCIALSFVGELVERDWILAIRKKNRKPVIVAKLKKEGE